MKQSFKHQKIALLGLIAALMGASGCTWDDSKYDIFYDSSTETGTVPCDNIQHIILQDKAGTIIHRGQADIDEKYELAFQYNICPKGFLCKNENGENICSQGMCSKGQTQCKGDCVDLLEAHISSCENDIIV